VRSLIQGTPATSGSPFSEPSVAQPVGPSAELSLDKAAKVAIPPWYYFAMDTLLAGAAVGLMFIPGHVSWKTMFVQGALIALGCALGIRGAIASAENR
jgi:hypothetical protein